MAFPSETIRLLTQPSIGTFTVGHYADPSIVLGPYHLRLNVVRAMGLPDADEIVNPDHSSIVESLRLDGEIKEEKITLPTLKAERLAEFFRGLRPQHNSECHDVVTAIEGWERDLGLELTQQVVQPPGFVQQYEDIISGTPYTVQILTETGFARSHSCVGTDNGKLLGLVGKGLVMATIDPATTRMLYANGARGSFIAKTILPLE